MDGQERVLQHRIERIALHRRMQQPHKRARGQGRVADEEGAQPTLDGQHQRLQPRRQAESGQGDDGAIAGQRQVPEQHRAFVAAPDSGHLVEQRLVGVGVGRDVGHREVRGDEGVHQGEEGHGDGDEASHRRALAGAGQRARPPPGRQGREHALRHRQGQRQKQAEGAELGDHEGPPAGAEPAIWASGRHSPDFLSESTTSLGM